MASNITLSASVRQNLLALQSTAQLMSETQNRLATGKKVNSALDNPGNFFTSQSLSNRASDLNALLDSIGQAQQTLKAADQGLTSLTKLVESAKSIAKQARQAPQPSDALYSAISVSGNPTDEVLGVQRRRRRGFDCQRHHLLVRNPDQRRRHQHRLVHFERCGVSDRNRRRPRGRPQHGAHRPRPGGHRRQRCHQRRQQRYPGRSGERRYRLRPD